MHIKKTKNRFKKGFNNKNIVRMPFEAKFR